MGGDAVEHYVFITSEFSETAEGRGVGFGRTQFAVLPEFYDLELHEVEEAVFAGVALKFRKDVGSGVWESVGIESADYLGESVNIPADALADGEQEGSAPGISGGCDHGSSLVPFVREEMIVGRKLSRFAIVDNLIVDCALPVGDGGGTEFYFYRGH